MNTLLAGILVIGGTGLIICGGLYLLFRFLDRRQVYKWHPTINDRITIKSDGVEISRPENDIFKHDTGFVRHKIGNSIGDWN